MLRLRRRQINAIELVFISCQVWRHRSMASVQKTWSSRHVHTHIYSGEELPTDGHASLSCDVFRTAACNRTTTTTTIIAKILLKFQVQKLVRSTAETDASRDRNETDWKDQRPVRWQWPINGAAAAASTSLSPSAGRAGEDNYDEQRPKGAIKN